MTILLSSVLVPSQASFIIRVVVEALSYGSLFLLPNIILSNAPRLASLETHDLLNRIVGGTTYLISSAKWVARQSYGQSNSYHPTFKLGIAIALFLVFRVLVSIGDVGLLGIYQCDVPYPNTPTFFASVQSDEDALNIVKGNLMPGKDPNTLLSLRCSGTTYQIIDKASNFSGSLCNSWHNSTYGNSTGFKDINSTDSDVFMPRRLSHFSMNGTDVYTNSFIRRIDSVRVSEPVLTDGIIVEPYRTGVRAIAGVPQLSNRQRVTIPKTLAIEAEIGCMSLGIEITDVPPGNVNVSQHLKFHTAGDWREYVGPDYLYGTLGRTVDEARELWKSYWFQGIPDQEGIIHNYTDFFDGPTGTFSYTTTIANGDLDQYILGNCTRRVHEQVGVAPQNMTDRSPDPLFFGYHKPHACDVLQLSGSTLTGANQVTRIISNYICATTTQVNMVDATIELDKTGKLSTSLTHLPSSIWITNADYGLSIDVGGNQTYVTLDGVLRYTLSDNSTGRTTHPIFQESTDAIQFASTLVDGVGSPGPTIAQLGSRMITSSFIGGKIEGILGIVDSHSYVPSFTAETVTKWAGEMGASYILGSIGYNGWAARNAAPLTIVSTGGKPATCFDLRYGIALFPAFAVAILALVWAAWVLLRTPFSGTDNVKLLYGGLGPYTTTIPFETSPQTPMAWNAQSRLHVVYDGQAVDGHQAETLAEYMKRSNPL